MLKSSDTFFTSIGCMDGRVQNIVVNFGKLEFGAEFPDTITEAGLDGVVGKGADQQILNSIAKKVLISVEKHNSRGIIVHGHMDCAGNPVEREQHITDIKNSVIEIKKILGERSIPVLGVYVKISPSIEIEKI